MADVFEIMLNPVRIRIVQEAAQREIINSSLLCSLLEDVPRTSIYRHIKILLDCGILRVVSEKKIRGSLERSLALNLEVLQAANSLENASSNALSFLLSKYAVLHRYFSAESSHPAEDKIFINTTLLTLDDDGFERFLTELRGLLVKYSKHRAKGGKVRDISILSLPV